MNSKIHIPCFYHKATFPKAPKSSVAAFPPENDTIILIPHLLSSTSASKTASSC